MKTQHVTNASIAEALETAARMLEEREANPHRVQAYLNAAATVRATEEPLAQMLEDGGLEALRTLPGVGQSLASRIGGFIRTGRLELLRELRANESAEALFTRLPGIGAELARRLHTELGVESLEELEMAAHDGRLAALEGFGARRVRALRAQLAFLLNRATRRHLRRLRYEAQRGPALPREDAPTVRMLLNVDLEYRARSRRDELEKIAPRRFNPSGGAWLPVLHTKRGPWAFTALFSNTARAHALDKTDDWVVLYYEQGGREGQYTVVTETRGELKGRRVVRGREAECHAYYAERGARAA